MNKGSFGNSGSTPLFIEAQTPKPKAKNQNQNSKKQSKTEDRNPQSCNIEAFKFNQKTEERERKEEQGVLKMEEVVLFVDDLHKISYCRICHEAEFESCKELEAPCACSGTAKFAHRECIQRWCDEKGDTICEICLQRYEPGYTAIPKQPKKIIVQDEVINIRESMEPSRVDHEFQNEDLSIINEYSSDYDTSASCCKTLALIFTVLLLMRHLLDALNGGSGHYPFSVFTILLLKMCGIIVPMFIIIRTITALQNSVRRYRNLHDSLMQNPNRGYGHQEHVHGRDDINLSA